MTTEIGQLLNKPVLYIWHIYRQNHGGYDTYSNAVVVATDETRARQIHPSNLFVWNETGWNYSNGTEAYGDCGWVKPENVIAECLGLCTTTNYNDGDVVCNSYHAG